jgi:hypothetical protein
MSSDYWLPVGFSTTPCEQDLRISRSSGPEGDASCTTVTSMNITSEAMPLYSMEDYWMPNRTITCVEY